MLDPAGLYEVAPDAPQLDDPVTRTVAQSDAFVVLNLVAATLWFFKGSAWAARIEAAVIRGDRNSLPIFRKLLGPENDGIVSAAAGRIDFRDDRAPGGPADTTP